jgi:Secretion system C-terminal sorting domain
LDIDGSFVYTPARLVVFDKLDAVTVKYYPNPTNGILTIELATANSNEIRVVNICNAAGAVINQLKIAANAGSKMQIDLSKYAKGIYFIQVKTATVNSTERIILR